MHVMTAEERNRILRYGQLVPRSWIPEFNRTHSMPRADGDRARRSTCALSETDRREYYAAKRRMRLGIRRQQTQRFNSNLRTLQYVIAGLIAFVGLLLAGGIGLGIGLLMGLLMISFRVPI
jgi:hypothetical protein